MRALRTMTAVAPVALLAAGAACSGGSGAGGFNPPARFEAHDAGAVPGGPGAGARYGIGRPATPAQVAAWDLDVGGLGAELPAGRGTVAEGEALYAAQCAQCHGAKGEGMDPAYPALVSRSPNGEFTFATDPKAVKAIGNYWSHAPSLFDYIKRAMPLTAPGSLSDDQVYALTAYLLAVNTVIPRTATLDAAALRAVKMPAADRFVPDDRKGGPEVK
jgi:S-disulfanyl-L-cysteine oxidoreductase SoxD